MAFCPYCGGALVQGANFCPGCGSPVTDLSAALTTPAVTTPAVTTPAVNTIPVVTPVAEVYSLVLISLGTCRASYADDVLEDVLGYSSAEAKTIVSLVPTQIAQGLTAQQAQYVAQALTEYGMQVAIYNSQGVAVDMGQYATSSVFNSDGSFLSGVLSTLATLTVANRIRSFTRWNRPNLLQALFAPRYEPVPPRHVRRSLFSRIFDPAPRRVIEPTPRRNIVSRPRGEFRSNPGGARGNVGHPGTGSRGGGRMSGGGNPGGNRGGGHGGRGR